MFNPQTRFLPVLCYVFVSLCTLLLSVGLEIRTRNSELSPSSHSPRSRNSSSFGTGRFIDHAGCRLTSSSCSPIVSCSFLLLIPQDLLLRYLPISTFAIEKKGPFASCQAKKHRRSTSERSTSQQSSHPTEPYHLPTSEQALAITNPYPAS